MILMRNERLFKAELKSAIDTCLSGFNAIPSLRNEIMQKVRGEVIMKRKLSAGLVLAIVLLLITFAAVAATLLWENYATKAKQIEGEQGSYVNWKIEDKIDLVKALVDMGYIEGTGKASNLFNSTKSEEEAHIIADQILMDLTQRDADDISISEITYAVMGYFTSWTPEQRVWWQELMGYESGAVDTFVKPGPLDLPVDDVIKIAKIKLSESYGLESGYFDKDNVKATADLYVTNNRPDYRRWMVLFSIHREDSDYLDRVYSVVIDNTGSVIADPDVEIQLPGEGGDMARYKLSDEKGHYIFWTHEERAQYMPERFIVPATDAISEAEAILIALEAVRSDERSLHINFEGYIPMAMFCKAIPDNPLNQNDYWVITLVKNMTKDYTNEGEVNVYIDAITGVVFYLF